MGRWTGAKRCCSTSHLSSSCASATGRPSRALNFDFDSCSLMLNALDTVGASEIGCPRTENACLPAHHHTPVSHGLTAGGRIPCLLFEVSPGGRISSMSCAFLRFDLLFFRVASCWPSLLVSDYPFPQFEPLPDTASRFVCLFRFKASFEVFSLVCI